jgi:hypothetical protein
VLITFSTGTPQGTVLRGFRDAGFSIPVIASASNLDYRQMKQFADILPAEIYFPGVAAFAYDSLPRGATKQAVSEYLSALNTAAVPADIGALYAWYSAQNILAALRKYGTGATPEQLRSFLSTYRGIGVLGPEDFATYRQRGIGPPAVIVVRWNPAKSTWVGVKI